MATAGRRRIDRILEAGFADGLESLPFDEVRERRAKATQEEALLSYERRLLHARMDILRDELRRRAEGGDPIPVVERLTQVLADEPSPSRGAFPQDVELPSFDRPRRRVEKLVSDDSLANLPNLADEEIRSIIASIEAVEHEVSEQRKSVQEVLDALTKEVARRYKTGEADPADVLSTGR